MSSENVESLINEFRTENTSLFSNPDMSNKVSLIRRLAYFDDPRIMPFFLQVVADRNEYDLARIEVLRLLEIRKHLQEDERNQVANVIIGLLRSELDDDVRNYAAMAAASFVDIPAVAAETVRLVFETGLDENLRCNLIAAIEKIGNNEQTREIFQSLTLDPSPALSKWATRVLAERRAN